AQTISANALTAISCPASDQCTAVDAGGNEATFSPTSTTLSSSLLVPLPGVASLSGVDCAAAWICVAVDPSGAADAGVVAPVNSGGLPSISLAQQQGIQTTETNGTWSGSPTGFTYQWEDCTSPTDTSTCSAVTSGGTAQSYTPAAADIGAYLRVNEQAHNSVMNSGGGSTTLDGVAVFSAASDPVTPTPAADSVPPTISSASGYYQQGQQLSDVHGHWHENSSAPITYSYQWQDCDPSGTTCSSIKGATDQTYTPTASDIGQTLRVLEVASNGGSPTPSAVPSAVTSVIQPSPPVAPAVAGAPSIGGTAQEGQMLTERHGLWGTTGSTTYTYQWEDCSASGSACTAIPGATHQTYTPTGSDVGFKLVVLEAADNGGRPQPAAVSSSPSAVVLPAAPASMSPPTIAGTVQQGKVLSEGHAVWSGGADTPTAYSYQWEDCAASGADCVRIPGATGATYTPVTSDIGHALVVLETASNAGGTTGPIASVPTAVTAPAPAPAILAKSDTASARRISGANVNATLVTLGLPVTWQFVYGLTTRYTAATPVQSIPAGGPTSVNVSQILTGLRPMTTYHFRIIESVAATAYAPAVTSTGQDMTFRTNSLGFMALTRTRLTVSHGQIVVPLRCKSGAGCLARFSIQAQAEIGAGEARHLGELLCSTAVIGIRAQHVKQARARLTKGCLALLASHGGRLSASFTTRPRTGQLGFVKRVTLAMSKQKNKKKKIRRHRGRTH
ncbi:MAG: hypothetical protein ACYCXW_17470, partial [Solirubrobacteraceae bacterium]